MRTHYFTETCDVCGGDGAANARTVVAAWNARAFLSHTDPRVCREVLDRREADATRQRAAS